jgi:hypothetical protein
LLAVKDIEHLISTLHGGDLSKTAR